jgi:DNA-binding transcriptional regulator YhcF (GntR family)
VSASIAVDPSSPVPPFEQVRRAIVALVERGQLAIGARLPTVRQLSADLAVAPGTIARAFRELESDGVVETRGRHGTFVTGSPRRTKAEHRVRVEAAIEELVAAALSAGVDADEVIADVRAALKPKY